MHQHIRIWSLAGFFAATPAIAQQVVTSPQVPNLEVASNSDDTGLGDIVVTANRRAESAQRVPISITAISADQMQVAATQDLSSAIRGVVGVNMDGNSVQAPELYIRGIGSNRFDIGGEPSAGTYIDEIYQPRPSNILGGLVDLDRVEVLRGPQGTLFGRNTVGGAVSVYTAAPTDRFEGEVAGGLGNKNYRSIDGHLNVPVSQILKLRLSGGYRDRDGFMKDVVSGRTNGARTYTFRGKALLNLNDRTTFQLTGTYYNAYQKAVLVEADTTRPLFLASPLLVPIANPGRYDVRSTIPGFNRLRQTQVDGRLIIDGDSAVTTLIGSYTKHKISVQQETDGTQNSIFSYDGGADTDTYSLEFRLSSQKGGILTFDNHLKWVIGAYLYQDKGSDFAAFPVGPDSIISFVAANPTFTPPFVTPTQTFSDRSSKYSNVKSLAFYFQGTYDLSSRFAVTVGGRYTNDQRNFEFIGTSDPNKPFPLPIVAAPFTLPGKVSNASFDPKAVLEFKPSKDLLFYASYSKGFKSAAIQAAPFDILSASVVPRPEKVDAYELGAKTSFLDRRIRFNVAGFVNKFTDLQVRKIEQFANGFASNVIQNAADSTIKGIETEIALLPIRGLRIDASYSYLDARYGTYIVDPVTGENFNGNRLPRAPKHLANIAGTYTHNLAGGVVTAHAEYNYNGGFYFQPENTPEARQGSYGITNASVSYTLPGDDITLRLFARNMFGVSYRTYATYYAPQLSSSWSDKATFGVNATFQF